jgi:hypothetical protein
MNLEMRYQALDRQMQALINQRRDLEARLTQTQGNIDATFGAMKILEELMGEEQQADDEPSDSGSDEQE